MSEPIGWECLKEDNLKQIITMLKIPKHKHVQYNLQDINSLIPKHIKSNTIPKNVQPLLQQITSQYQLYIQHFNATDPTKTDQYKAEINKLVDEILNKITQGCAEVNANLFYYY